MGTIWLGGNEANSSLLHTSITACLSALLSLFLGSGLVAVGLLSAPISPSIRQRCKVLVDNPITSQALSCLAPDATAVQTHCACFCLSTSDVSCPLFPSNRHRTFFRVRVRLRLPLMLYPFFVTRALAR